MWIYISSDSLHICILLFPSISMPEGWHLRNSSCQLPCSISGLKAPLCSPANGCKGSSSYWLDFSLLALTGSMNTHRAAEPGCRLGPAIGKKPQGCCFQKPYIYQHTVNSSWDHSPPAKVLLCMQQPLVCVVTSAALRHSLGESHFNAMGNQVPVQSDTPWNLILEFNLLAQFEDDFRENVKIVGSH